MSCVAVSSVSSLRRASLGRILACCLAIGSLVGSVVGAQTPAVTAGAGALADAQALDGSWDSAQVRPTQATAEALAALAELGLAPAARSAAADVLETAPVLDNDDRARRTAALALEGRAVGDLVNEILLAGAEGGWGLSATFGSAPLDTSLSLIALAEAGAIDGTEAFLGLVELIEAQSADGGWPCVAAGESEPSCTAEALLALAPYRVLFDLSRWIDAGVAYLGASFEADGAVAAPAVDRLYTTALAVRALLAVDDELAGRRTQTTAWLEARQDADGAWEADPYATAVVLRALRALETTPFCGDALLNSPRERCDGFDLGTLTCEGLGFGPGTLSCDASCQPITASCDPAPVCGDGAINRASESCDLFDLAGETCETLGFGGGTLSCSDRCTYDTDACIVEPVCGDGVVNQPSEICDVADFGGASCSALGLGDGELACRTDCRFDASGCSAEPRCGDGVINGPLEVCDGGDLAGLSCSTFGGTGTLGCATSCTRFDVAGCAGLPDADEDGFPAGEDCDDTDPEVNPGAEEIPLNQRDDDCDPRTPDLLAECGVDVVFLMDTSGSMNDDASALCSRISQVQTNLAAIGIQAQSQLWGISETRGGSFSCLTSAVTRELGGSVPGDDGRCDGFLNQSESWGQASAIVAERFPWAPDAIRVVVPISDEGPCNGNRCYSTGSDGDSVINAATLALQNQVFVSPIVARGANSCTANLARFAADETGGVVSFSTNPDLDLSAAIANLLVGACEDTYVLTLDPALALNPPGTEHEVTATVTNSLGLPLAGREVRFEVVVGQNAGAVGVANSDADGRARFTFTGSGDLGVDQIAAEVDDAIGRLVLAEPAWKFWDLDCNENGRPDSCDLSCDAFEGTCGLWDACGASSDVDDDGAPDECLLPNAGTDDDEDGYPLPGDCDDSDPAVNPGADEIPGNGIDDDCNPGTPDVVPPGAVDCTVVPDATGYGANATMSFDVRVRSGSETFTWVGLDATLEAIAADGSTVALETRSLPPLAPGALEEQLITASTGTAMPGTLTVTVDVTAGGASGATSVATCSADTLILSSADRGPLLAGAIEAQPDEILAGEPAVIAYRVDNVGNVDAAPALWQVQVVDPATDEEIYRYESSAPLAIGEFLEETVPMPDLPAGEYLLVLRGGVDSADEDFLASNGFRVVNVPPDCSGAFVSPGELWPPNHKMSALALGGVVDPDGDPVTLEVLSIFQDEPTDANGDGNTCVDAEGVGTATPSVRRERQGGGDGRVYHVRFLADDGRGGTCEAVGTVCVPHSKKSGCVDQGALYDSTVCP